MLWAEHSASSTLDLGISHEVFFLAWPCARLRTEDTAYLRGGQAPSVKPTLSQRKIRDLTGSPRRLTVDMSQAKSITPSSLDTGADEEKGAKKRSRRPRGVGGNTEPHLPSGGPGGGLEFLLLQTLTNQGKGGQILSALTPSSRQLTNTDGLQTAAQGSSEASKW